jgi:MtfA peptidase
MVSAILIATLIIVLAMRYKSNVRHGYRYVGRAVAPVRVRLTPVPLQFKSLLKQYFPYYSRLNADEMRRFERKVCYVIFSKQFIPRNFKTVTDEMKVLIAASAVQLTFGLPKVTLSHFNKILIYTDDYYSAITKRYHKGEVNPAFGVIVLSWQSFVEGYLVPGAKVNLGLHEMAHALRLENIIRNEEFHFFDDDLLNRFDAWGHKICFEMPADVRFFRPYACTNPQEFFAVAVENFFEHPQQFKSELPALYDILSKLLHQDPLRYQALAA